MLTPKVSIITVCYNSEKTIEDTIQTVLFQDYPNIEYIILDGLSSDNTLSIIRKYSKFIHYFHSEEDNGMYDAINRSIDIATGEIIGILNADDFYTDKKVISDVVRTMNDTESEALYADLYYVSKEDTSQVKRYWKSGNYKYGMFLSGWMPPHPTFFVKKSVYIEYGKFNLDLKTAADYELMLRFIHKYKLRLCYLPRVIVRMRLGGMSNESFLNRLKANREDKKAWEINKLKYRRYTFFFKPLRKVIQYLAKK